jgi:hypothetical protein
MVILDQDIAAGQWVSIPVYAGASSNLAGMQLAFDLKGIEFGGISANAIPLETPDYFLAPDHTLRISWAGVQQFIAEGEVLFTLLVRNPAPGWIHQWIAIDQPILAPEAYVDEELNISDVKLSFRLDPQQEHRDFIHNILPNPTTGTAQLQVELAEEGLIEIRVFNTAGGYLGEIQLEGKKGFNDIGIDFSAMHLRSGLAICQIQTSRTMRVQKIVVLD